MINSISVPVAPSGAFEYELPTPPQGEYNIRVEATDNRGNEESRSIKILKIDTSPPLIQVIAPKDGTQITGSEMEISCSVKDNAQIKQVTIHGEKLLDPQTFQGEREGATGYGEEKIFKYLIRNMKEGANQIEIIAVDVNGNENSETLTLISLHPDYNSGDDKDASGARQLDLNSRYEDSLSFNAGDQSDWYQIRSPKYGELSFRIQSQIAENVHVQVYSTEPGEELPTNLIPPIEVLMRGSGEKELHCKVAEGQLLFVKVFSPQKGDGGDYSIENSFYEIDNKEPRIIVRTKELSTSQASITINGTAKDEKEISGIFINGKQLLPLPDRLPGASENIRPFSSEVALQVGRNKIIIKVEDSSGNRAEETVFAIRENPSPLVEIKSPVEGARFREDSLNIIGIVLDDEEVRRVTLNDIDISDTLKTSSDSLIHNRGKQGKEFEYQLSLEEYGEHRIVVVAFDNFGAEGQQVLTIYRDEPPEITIESPPENFHTTADSVLIQGRVDNDWEAVEKITVNGVALPTISSALKRNDGSGVRQSFTQQVTLKYGENPMQIDAEDQLGNIHSKLFTIVREEVDPAITISIPEEQVDTIANSILIKGVAFDDDGIAALTIDGEAVKFNKASGEFSHQIKLAYGPRKISIAAKDIRGNETEEFIHVTRLDRDKPSIELMNDEDGMKTRNNEFLITLKASDNHRLKSIHLNDEPLYDDTEELGAEKVFNFLVKDLLDGFNLVKIIVKDESGNTAIRSIQIHKVPAPAISIAGEISGTLYTEDKTVHLSGTIQTADEVASLSINEEKVVVDKQNENSFSYVAKDLLVGENSLMLIAIDTLGGTRRRPFVIVRNDNTRPELTITSPRDGDKTKEDDILVEIMVHDDDRIAEIMINGETLTGYRYDVPGAPLKLTHSIEGLRYGSNQIQVVVSDASGNRASRTYEIYRVLPPKIVVSHPVQPARTVAPSVLVEGYIQSDAGIESVLIDGESAKFDPDNSNRFSQVVSLLKPEDHEIKLIAIDSLGGISENIITIKRMGPDYQSGPDRSPDGAISLPINGIVNNNLTVHYDAGDQTDWFSINIETTGDWLIRVTNTDTGTLDLELYGSDGTSKLQSTQIYGESSDELTVQVSQAGRYYAKVMAHGLGDRGEYTINNRFYEVDRIPPEISLTAPHKKEVWLEKGDSLKIVGTASDNTGMKKVDFQAEPDSIKTIGGSSQEVDNMLNFEQTFSDLQPGTNILKITAIDQADNPAEYILHILVGKENLDASLIKLSSIRPAKIVATDENGNIRKVETQSKTLTIEGEVLAGGIQNVRGYVQPAGKRGLDVKPITAHMKTAREFSLETDLLIGKNTIIIEALHGAEYKKQLSLIAVRSADPQQPDVSSQSPMLLQEYLELRQGDVYAVIIGISDYEDARITDLRFTVNDAQGMYDVLVNPDYGRVNPDNIKLLLDKEATVPNIKAAIGTWLSQKAKEEDTVLIYYAGHGAEEEGKEGYTYWLTHEANSEDYYSSALSNNAIVDMLDRIKSKRQVIFLDSCHSAATVIAKNKSNAKQLNTRSVPARSNFNFSKKFVGEGRAIISASKGEQLSVELEKYKHGVFTYFLLEGLKGKAEQNGDAVIDVNEIWDYINVQVPVAAERDGGNPQTPVLESEKLTLGILLTFDLPFFRRKLQDREYHVRGLEIIGLYEARKLSTEEYRKIMHLLKNNTTDHILEEYFNRNLSLEELQEILQHRPNPLAAQEPLH